MITRAWGPEHSWLNDAGRAEYVSVTDTEALEGFELMCRVEGIIPALEPAHAAYYISQLAPTLSPDKIILMGLSGRGDKDMDTVAFGAGCEHIAVSSQTGVNIDEREWKGFITPILTFRRQGGRDFILALMPAVFQREDFMGCGWWGFCAWWRVGWGGWVRREVRRLGRAA